MALDFNTEPFFDDYAESDNFHRVLFRPGYAVQGRELTQLQTILQEQVRRHGDHVFKEGAMVIPGQISYDTNLGYVKLATTSSIASTLSELIGKEIKNEAGLIAKVVAVEPAETVNSVTEPNTLFVKYMNSLQDANGANSAIVFSVNDYLSPVDGTTGLGVTVAATAPVGVGCSATIQAGIYYIKKNFVRVADQTIILDKYSNTPNYRVGLQLVEEVIYPEDDENLLDNAQGSPNYAAPGACRYKMTLQLTKIAVDANIVAPPGTDIDFIDLLRLHNGEVVFKIDHTLYSEIEKTMARRTYDESGDYAISQFDTQIRDYRNNLRGSWATGAFFIQGDIIKVPLDGADPSVGNIYFVATVEGQSGSSPPDWSTYEVADFFTDNTVIWEHVVFPQFNNGVYTFLAGNTAYNTFTLNDHKHLAAMVVYGVEAGKAYVRGYEIEKIATEYLPVYKSRNVVAGSDALCAYFGLPNSSLPAIVDSTSGSKTTTIDMSMGSFVYVKDVAFLPDVKGLADVTLYNVAMATVKSGSNATDPAMIVGYARIRGFEKNDPVNSITPTYKVFLFDIRTNSGKDFKNVESIYAGTGKFECNINKVALSPTTINQPDDGSLIWSIPDYAIENITEADYVVVKSFTGTSSGTPATVSFTAPTGYTFESVYDNDNYIFANSSGAIVTPATSGGALSVVRTNDTTITLTATAGVYTMLGSMRLNAVSSAGVPTLAELSLTLNEGSYTSVTPAIVQAKSISLGYPYVTRIVAVLMSTALDNGETDPFTCSAPVYSTNITSRFVFDSGQESSLMRNSAITLAEGYAPPEGPIKIKFEYLSYSDTQSTFGHFIGVNSYVYNGSKVRYDQIPQVYGHSLRDSIDFRPMASGSGFIEHYFPKYGSIGTFAYTNYLSRIDNIALSSNGSFVVTRGIPSDIPFEPGTPKLSMRLSAVSLEPYTFTRGNQIGSSIQRAENKRYTMRDIGKLERRVQDLEYYTSLSLTELDTKNMRIVDSIGLDRYQNGFLVDSFDGQGIGNSASNDWNCSIDSQNKELRPFFSQKQVTLYQNTNSATSYQVSGDLVTLKFNEVPLIVQNKASLTENVNPYALYAWRGTLDINPWSDTWFSTEYRPDIIINDSNQYDAIISKANADGVLGTIWNAWQVIHSSAKSLNTNSIQRLRWSGLPHLGWNDWTSFTPHELSFINGNSNIGGNGNNIGDFTWDLNFRINPTSTTTIETSATESTNSRTGTFSYIVDKVDSRVVDERVVDTSVIPYIRPRTILFTGYGFKPSTALNAFFDNVPVNDYIIPATRFEVTPVSSYASTFDVERNAGSDASTKNARKMYYDDGTTIPGTVSIVNNSTTATITGIGTSFLRDVLVGHLLNFGHSTRYRVTQRTDNTTITVTPPYVETIPVAPVPVKVIGDIYNTEETEIAFTHGEIVTVSGSTTNTGIVVGQEKVLIGSTTKYYIYVLNLKGNFKSGDVLLGEFGSTPSRVSVVARTDYAVPTTSETGLLCGLFKVPCNPMARFRTGTRELQFSDSNAVTSELRSAQQSTVGSGMYVAQGTLQTLQRTIVATRTAQVVSEQVSETNTVTTTHDRLVRDTGWRDPLAQTFLIQQTGGAFITSVDLYFATRDTKVPVRIEVREVVNGYPGASVIPFSRVEKKGIDISVDSSTGLVATNFKFISPVYLQNGIEYALVIMSDSNNYRVWISQTDQIDVATKTRISSQPYNGVLFKSQNSTAWTPDQTQDLKFKINRAEFLAGTGTLSLIPPDLSYKNLGFNPLYFTATSRYMRVSHPNHGHIVGEYVKLKNRAVSETAINGVTPSDIFNRVDLNVVSCDLDNYVVQLPSAATVTGWAGGGFVCASENFEYSTAMVDIAELIPEGTNVAYTINTLEHGGNSNLSDQVVPKENKEFGSVRIYGGDTNQAYNQNHFYGLSLDVVMTRSPLMDNLSPVIDLGRLGITLVNNKIDSPYPISGAANSINYAAIDYMPILGASSDATFEIGTSPKEFQISSSGLSGAYNDVLAIDNTVVPVLYAAMNKLNTGDFLKFSYSNSVDSLYFTVVEKVVNGNVLFFTLEYYSDPATLPLINTSANTVSIMWLSRFKSELAPLNSSTHSKYVTKKINFSRPSDMLKIMFDAIIPIEADVEVYYKTGLSIASDFLSSRYIRALPNGTSYVKSENEFKAIVIDVERLPTAASSEYLTPFDSVMVKLVMKSTNRAKVPRIKNLRIIACAAV